MSDEEAECKCPPAGAPLWMATFADLMSLLMCFFVLLLSFSEMDVQKYKAVSGSMKNAFGVQRKMIIKDDPAGTSFIMKNYGPGTPSVTPLPMIQQRTQSKQKSFVKIAEKGDRSSQATSSADNAQDKKGENSIGSMDQEEMMEQMEDLLKQAESDQQASMEADLEEQAEALKDALHDEIAEGLLEVLKDENRIIVRINEKASFASGSAVPLGSFKPIAVKVVTVLADFQGDIVVAGHSDNQPINTIRFRSNWELSVSRAVSIIHLIEDDVPVEPGRLRVEGYGDTKPIRPNDTAVNRAENRRVEISIVRENDKAGTIEGLREAINNDG